tara:strand:- start:131 stop:466 length:336 start_codon:yes stop_codon:yes gene_type:complete
MEATKTKIELQEVLSSIRVTRNPDMISFLGSPWVNLHGFTFQPWCPELTAISITVKTHKDLNTLSEYLGREIIKGADCTQVKERPFQAYELADDKNVRVTLFDFVNPSDNY